MAGAPGADAGAGLHRRLVGRRSQSVDNCVRVRLRPVLLLGVRFIEHLPAPLGAFSAGAAQVGRSVGDCPCQRAGDQHGRGGLRTLSGRDAGLHGDLEESPAHRVGYGGCRSRRGMAQHSRRPRLGSLRPVFHSPAAGWGGRFQPVRRIPPPAAARTGTRAAARRHRRRCSRPSGPFAHGDQPEVRSCTPCRREPPGAGQAGAQGDQRSFPPGPGRGPCDSHPHAHAHFRRRDAGSAPGVGDKGDHRSSSRTSHRAGQARHRVLLGSA